MSRARAGGSWRRTLVVLAAVHVAAVLAPILAPYDPARQHRQHPLAPPTTVHVVDAEGRWRRPFVWACTEVGRPENCEARRFPVQVFTGAHLFGVEEPAWLFVLGTDALGRDVLSRVLHGARVSLLSGLLAAALALGLGVLLGSLAGYYGGWRDRLVMRAVDAFEALPWLYLLLAVRAFLPLRMGPVESFLLIVALVGVLGWARPARVLRGVVLAAREREYVLAARSFGASDLYIMRRHVLPQTSGVLLAQASLLVPAYMLAEVTLSFLGLGVAEPVPSWGGMLAGLLEYPVLTRAWWLLAPGVAVAAVCAAYLKLNLALEEKWRNVQV